MIVKEFYKTREEGKRLIKIYSDRGMKIEAEGVRYTSAIDVEGTPREYTETDELINDEISDREAMEIIMGVK